MRCEQKMNSLLISVEKYVENEIFRGGGTLRHSLILCYSCIIQPQLNVWNDFTKKGERR